MEVVLSTYLSNRRYYCNVARDLVLVFHVNKEQSRHLCS